MINNVSVTRKENCGLPVIFSSKKITAVWCWTWRSWEISVPVLWNKKNRLFHWTFFLFHNGQARMLLLLGNGITTFHQIICLTTTPMRQTCWNNNKITKGFVIRFCMITMVPQVPNYHLGLIFVIPSPVAWFGWACECVYTAMRPCACQLTWGIKNTTLLIHEDTSANLKCVKLMGCLDLLLTFAQPRSQSSRVEPS